MVTLFTLLLVPDLIDGTKVGGIPQQGEVRDESAVFGADKKGVDVTYTTRSELFFSFQELLTDTRSYLVRYRDH